MGIYVHLMSFDMDAVDFHETLREPSVGIIPIFMQHLMKFSSVAFHSRTYGIVIDCCHYS